MKLKNIPNRIKEKEKNKKCFPVFIFWKTL